MTGFHNVVFPLSLAFGASGGPVRRTDIINFINGAEQRNSPHVASRRRYNAGAGIKSLDDIHTLIAFFEARRGQLYSFRFKDPMDFKSCPPSVDVSDTDQVIGTGDGTATTFQLIKTYRDIAGGWTRSITKPVINSVLVAVNGVPQTPDIDHLTGKITFAVPPAEDAQITAGFGFHVPVRFDTDSSDLTLEAFGAGEVANIPLIEVGEYA